MSDWKGDDNSPKKKKKPKANSLPVIPRNDESSQPKSWAGRSVAPSMSSSEPKRSWTDESATDSSFTRMSVRKILLWLLTPTVAIATLVFIYFISQQKDTRIPLLMILAKGNQPSELGELGNLDGRGASDSVTKVLTTTGNILEYMRDAPDGWLKKLDDDAGLKAYLKPAASNEILLQGGGPSNKFIAFYLRCFALRLNEQVVLVCSSDQTPFPSVCNSEDSSNAGLRLTDALKGLAKGIPNHCFAVIGLDVSPPAPIHNLGDLSFPANAFQDAFNSLDETEKRKLILFLPCSEGEENWPLPKSGMTVFGANFLDGLTALFGEKDLSLEGFDVRLQAHVNEWVAQNRKSRQVPKRIVDEDTWRKIKDEKFLGFFAARPKTTNADAANWTKPSDRYKELNDLWKRHEALAASRLEPDKRLALASLESHLLLLEDMVEFNPTTWDKIVASAEDILTHQLHPTKQKYEVSWIEDMQNQADGGKDFAYLENQLRSILMAEIDPDTDRDDNKKKLAEETLNALMTRWQEIQRLACEPRRELCWWMADRIQGLDREFLKAVDLFVANDFETSRRILVQSSDSLVNTSNYRDKISAGMEFRDDASSFLPHAMAFLVRLSRFPESQPRELESQAKRLADIAVELRRMENLLGDLKQDPSELAVNENVKVQLRESREFIRTMAQGWLSEEQGDAETIRNLRVAVRYPFLTSDSRVKAHDKLAQRFEEEDITQSRSTQVGNDSVRKSVSEGDQKFSVAQTFLEQMNARHADAECRKYWRTILEGDLRGSNAWSINLTHPPESYRELYESSRRVQRIAGALGMHSVSHSDILHDSCAGKVLDSYAAQNELRYRRMQRERLLLARWGSPEVDIAQIEGDFRFQEFARKYSTGADELLKRVLPNWNFEAKATAELDEHFQWVSNRLLAMSGWLNAEIEGASKIRFTWIPGPEDSHQNLWESIEPAIKISDNTAPNHVTLSTLLKETNRLFDIPKNQDLNAGNVDVTMAFRGHHLRSRALSDQILFSSDVQSNLRSQLTARIKNEKRSVVILLDCSGSMNDGNRMKNAEQTVKSLIEIFRNSVRAGQDIDVSLVALGIFSTEPELKKYGFQPSEIGDQYLGYVLGDNGPKYSHVAHTDFDSIKADESTSRRWERLLDAPFVAPGLNTPLYDAIDFACGQLSKRPEGTRELVILSDGGNYLSPSFTAKNLVESIKGKDSYLLKELPDPSRNESKFSYKGPTGDCTKAINQVLSAGASLYFYQVRDSAGQADSEADKEAKLFVYKLEDLKGKSLLMTPTDPYKDFLEIEKRIRADFALPEIKVHDLASQEGEDRTFSFLEPEPITLRPTRMQLKVVKNQLEELTRKPLELEAYGGQHVQVEFDARGRELIFKTSKELREDNRFEATLDSKNEIGNDDAASKYVMTWDLRRNESKKNAFRLKIDLRRERDRKPTEYLPWPKFAVGKLTRIPPSEDSKATTSTLLVSDLEFEDKHYPNLEFRIENLREKTWELSGANLDLWWSFADVNAIFGTSDSTRYPVASDAAPSEIRGWKISRTGATIRAERELRLAQDKAQWVICPDAGWTSREYRDRADKENRWTEIHTFTLSDQNAAKAIDLYVVSEEELEKLAEESATRDPRVYRYTGIKEPRLR